MKNLLFKTHKTFLSLCFINFFAKYFFFLTVCFDYIWFELKNKISCEHKFVNKIILMQLLKLVLSTIF